MAENIVRIIRSFNYYPRIDKIEGFTEGAKAIINGKECVTFASNDYLGLSRHPRMIEAAIEATKLFGVGSGGSRLTAGTQAPHCLLEAKISEFKGTEDAMVYSAGYLANIGIMPALIGGTLKKLVLSFDPQNKELLESTEIFVDQLAHASIIDGITLTAKGGNKVPVQIFKNRDMAHLEALLEDSTAGNKLVVTDGVFSLHGRMAPLDQMVQVTKKFNAEIYVDDAHSTGIFGENGRGTAELYGVEDEIAFQVGTLSKALGGQGGFIAGSKDLCDYLRVAARTHMFQTSMPAGIAMALTVALDLIREEPWRRQRLIAMAEKVRNHLTSLGFNIFNSTTQILPVGFKNEANAKKAAEMLMDDGIFAPPYYYPAVGQDEAMVRVNLTAIHTDVDIEKLLDALEKIGRKLGII